MNDETTNVDNETTDVSAAEQILGDDSSNVDETLATEPAVAPTTEEDIVEPADAVDDTAEGDEDAVVSIDAETVGAPEAAESTEAVDEEAVDDEAQPEERDELAAAAAALGDTTEEDSEAEYRRRLRRYVSELKKLPGDWYIIQCYSGYENKVKTNLDMRAQTLEVEEYIYDVVVPIEQVIEIKDGKRKMVKRKLLPGYVLVRMEMNDKAWSVVRDTPGVTSFVGNEGNATVVKHRDVAKFLMPKEATVEGEAAAVNAEGEKVVAMPEEQAKPTVAIDFEVGEAVTILTGALASVSATISEIDPVTGKIQALVSIFGRETPVELTADQIEKIS
ncbi:transcription termination/antitermination protein NusG [Corynebacterium sp.]|uniref:transcription termination/antitermination protein NusG n=1 Tax=Corynebacterium sp. TaxID=1720 RepID=UPI0026DF2D55|nr:transcription termination/antitermination protein NusG [Corynebacterium sp.]MDO5512329.1 transcription termination/antitermination protein NusG [Corynebacterium sp.]